MGKQQNLVSCKTWHSYPHWPMLSYCFIQRWVPLQHMLINLVNDFQTPLSKAVLLFYCSAGSHLFCFLSSTKMSKNQVQVHRETDLFHQTFCIMLCAIRQHSPINDVEVVTIIPLINDMFPSFNQLFKHCIQHLRHLLLFKRTWKKTSNYYLLSKSYSSN